MSTSRRRRPRFEKCVEARVVTYRLTSYVSGVPFGIELCITRAEYDVGRAVVARRLLRARTKLRLMADAVAMNREFA
jgi:hypothetical protein